MIRDKTCKGKAGRNNAAEREALKGWWLAGGIPGGWQAHPTFYIEYSHTGNYNSSRKDSWPQTTLGQRTCILPTDMRRRQFTLAVLLPLPGLVLCGGGIMAMESCVEDWTELSKSCFRPFGTGSPLGGLPTKGFGEDLTWKPFCSLSETPFWVLTAGWVCGLERGHGSAWVSCLPVRLEIWSNCWPK